MNLRPLCYLLFLSLSGEAIGQICDISHYPYGFGSLNYPLMSGTEFEAISDNLPFLQKDENFRYSQFWVNTDVLNVRSGPSLDHEKVSETYYGNLVFALAKSGEWVAISSEYTHQNIEVPPYWVNIRYLSANRIHEQVDTRILESKCSFKAYGELVYKFHGGTYNACNSVLSYLSDQRLLSHPHTYWKNYEEWRQSQSFPEKYKSQPCML